MSVEQSKPDYREPPESERVACGCSCDCTAQVGTRTEICPLCKGGDHV
jgi:hypothetical protein